MQRADHDQWNSTEVARLLALVETERRYYQDIFALLPIAVALVDPGFRLVAANREFRRRFGLQQADFSRMGLPEIIASQELEAAMAEVLHSGRAISGLEISTATGGQTLSSKISIQRVPGWQSGSEDELLLTFEDVQSAPVAEPARTMEPPPPSPAEQEARERAVLARVETAKRGAVERLSGRLAHVANNLLMIIGGYGEELKNSLPENDERRGDVEEILKAAGRLGALTKDLNALTRPATYEVAEFRVPPWMKATGERLRDLNVECGETGRALAARTSPLLLEQMVFEAARYLRPFLEPDAKLRLDAGVTGAERIEVRLSWPGSAVVSDALERFFEPFAGEKVGTDPPLGFAGLVRPWEKLGGTVELDADGLRMQCDGAAAPEQPEARATLLVVEDEAGIRSLVAKALERQGYRVLQAAAPAEALSLCTDLIAGPDMLITDLMVPGMSGGELARRIREQWPQTSVLFISGYTSDRELAERIGSGTLPERMRFLAKPFTTAELAAEVKSLLDTQ